MYSIIFYANSGPPPSSYSPSVARLDRVRFLPHTWVISMYYLYDPLVTTPLQRAITSAQRRATCEAVTSRQAQHTNL